MRADARVRGKRRDWPTPTTCPGKKHRPHRRHASGRASSRRWGEATGVVCASGWGRAATAPAAGALSSNGDGRARRQPPPATQSCGCTVESVLRHNPASQPESPHPPGRCAKLIFLGARQQRGCAGSRQAPGAPRNLAGTRPMPTCHRRPRGSGGNMLATTQDTAPDPAQTRRARRPPWERGGRSLGRVRRLPRRQGRRREPRRHHLFNPKRRCLRVFRPPRHPYLYF